MVTRIALAVMGSVCSLLWLVLLVATNFSCAAFSLGLLGMLVLTARSH